MTSTTKIMLNLQLNGNKCKSFQGFSLTIQVSTISKMVSNERKVVQQRQRHVSSDHDFLLRLY